VRPGLPFDELGSLFGARRTGVHADHRDAGWSEFVSEVLGRRSELGIVPIVVWSAARPERLMMRLPPCAAICGAASRVVRR
jgi:hypothetical protein